MKILHIITGLNDGGAEAILYRLCKFNKSQSHHVISLSGPGKYGEKLEKIGVNTHYLDLNNVFEILFSPIKLFFLIKKIDPNIVQTWMYHADFMGGLIAKLSGIKKIFWGVHHTTLVKNESKKITIMIANINCFLSKFIPTNIIYCAQKSMEVHKEFGFDNKKGVVIRNGYDIKEFFPFVTEKDNANHAFNLPNTSFRIGHVGRDDPQKDHITLLNAFDILREKKLDFHATLVGTGLDNDNQRLLKIIREKNLSNHVSLLGRRDEIPKYMNLIDLFVLSSSFGEAFPNVLNEAMACGTPCIATDIGDSKYIVGNSGWIVPPKCPEVFADKIIYAANEKKYNPSEWDKRKFSCRERIVNNFSIETMVEKYKKEWSRI